MNDSDDSRGHGSCVAAKAIGRRNGVSKRTELVVMKTTRAFTSISAALSNTLDDILNKDRQGKSVVALAKSSTVRVADMGADEKFIWESSFREIFDGLRSSNTVVVVPAGSNASRSRFTDDYPAGLSPSRERIPGTTSSGRRPLFSVAGAVSERATVARFSQKVTRQKTLWAPAQGLVCANRTSHDTIIRSGTSYSVGMVRGIFSSITVNTS